MHANACMLHFHISYVYALHLIRLNYRGCQQHPYDIVTVLQKMDVVAVPSHALSSFNNAIMIFAWCKNLMRFLCQEEKARAL